MVRRSLILATFGLIVLPATGAVAEPWEEVLAKLYPAAKQEGEFVFNTERTEEVGGKEGLALFAKRFPGIKVNFSGMAGSEMPSRIAAEAKAGKVSIDVFRADPDRAEPLEQRGLLLKLNPAELSDQPVQMFLDGSFVKLSDQISNFAYNTDLVKAADAPKTYQDLLNPKWKGRLALDARGGQIAHLLSTHIMDETTFWNFVDGLKKQEPIWTSRNTEAAAKVVSGEGWIGTGSYDAIQQLKAKGAPVEFAFVSPALSQVRGAAIVKGAAHPNAAKLFLGWLLSPEGLAIRDKNFVGTISPGTRLYDVIKAKNVQVVYETDINAIMARDKVGEQITKRWGVLK